MLAFKKAMILHDFLSPDGSLAARLIDCCDNMLILVVFHYYDEFPDDEAYITYALKNYITSSRQVLIFAYEDGFYSFDDNPDFHG